MLTVTYADCHLSLMLSVVILTVVILTAVMLSVEALIVGHLTLFVLFRAKCYKTFYGNNNRLEASFSGLVWEKQYAYPREYSGRL